MKTDKNIVFDIFPLSQPAAMLPKFKHIYNVSAQSLAGEGSFSFY